MPKGAEVELSHHGQRPDWTELITAKSAKWVDAIKQMYKDKGLPEGNIFIPLAKEQGKLFDQAIDYSFGNVTWDTPDHYMREVIKQNTWRFSIAKNHQDMLKLNNLLVRDDDSIRPWHEFKREAQKVAGTSVKYLKTEYNTIVASAQMNRLWADIQRDKHIFPFVQFSVVTDKHISDICKPLDDVIVTVDDPMLATFLPPNHFNCRTTLKQLRRGVPTKDYAKPDIHQTFKNNTGITRKVFTDDNSYIKNTPEDVLYKSGLLYADELQNKFKQASIEVRRKLEEYKLKHPFYQKTDNPLVQVSIWADRGEVSRNLLVAQKISAKFNIHFKLPPHTDGRVLKQSNPEYYIDRLVADRKSPKGLGLKRVFRSANSKQKCEVVILDLENNPNSIDDMLREVQRKLNNKTNYSGIKRVIIISKDIKEFRDFIR